MTLTIQILAWIGLATVVVLSVLTLLIWVQWIACGMMRMGSTYRAMASSLSYCARNSRAGLENANARVLWARFQKLAEKEPEIARQFALLQKWKPTPICGAGFAGCYGGPNCDSDHK